MGVFKLGKMTLGSLFKKPETLQYPFETEEPPAGLKGHISIDATTCILCGMCDRSCPADAIGVDKPQRQWSIDPLRCIQCGYCVQICPKNSLTMEPTYSPVTTNKDRNIVEIPEQEKPAKKEPAAKE